MLNLRDVVIEVDGFRLSANWSVESGEAVSILGPSGSGKSTLLNAIAGFQTILAGQIILDGQDISRNAPGKRPVSLLFQDHNLFPHLSVGQNVGLGLSPNLRLDPSEWQQVERSLTSVGLDGFRDRMPATLSGGQQSRVALARVGLMSRPVVLLDEPFSALGPAQRAEMLDLVKRTLSASGATLLMVTHDPADARRLGGRCVFVADGLAHPPEDTEKLLNDPPATLKAYLG
jgi:thiamine transport system ATP-binding protein